MRKRKDENKTTTENKPTSKCVYPNCEMVKMKDAQIKALEAKLHEIIVRLLAPFIQSFETKLSGRRPLACR